MTDQSGPAPQSGGPKFSGQHKLMNLQFHFSFYQSFQKFCVDGKHTHTTYRHQCTYLIKAFCMCLRTVPTLHNPPFTQGSDMFFNVFPCHYSLAVFIDARNKFERARGQVNLFERSTCTTMNPLSPCSKY